MSELRDLTDKMLEVLGPKDFKPYKGWSSFHPSFLEVFEYVNQLVAEGSMPDYDAVRYTAVRVELEFPDALTRVQRLGLSRVIEKWDLIPTWQITQTGSRGLDTSSPNDEDINSVLLTVKGYTGDALVPGKGY